MNESLILINALTKMQNCFKGMETQLCSIAGVAEVLSSSRILSMDKTSKINFAVYTVIKGRFGTEIEVYFMLLNNNSIGIYVEYGTVGIFDTVSLETETMLEAYCGSIKACVGAIALKIVIFLCSMLLSIGLDEEVETTNDDPISTVIIKLAEGETYGK